VPCSLAAKSDRLMLRRLLQNFISNASNTPRRDACWSAAGAAAPRCRSASTTPASAFPCSSAARYSRNFTAWNRARGSRAAWALGCRSSSGWRGVLNHGIAIDANTGGGSVFSVTVPTAAAVDHTAAVTSATPLARTPISGSLVVCIENDAAILDGMRNAVDGLGCRGDRGDRSDAAIEAIEAAGGQVTGLLVDYHLDRGNGVAAIRDIRRRFGESIPAILITADRSPHVRGSSPRREHRGAEQAGEAGVLRALLGQWLRSRWSRRSRSLSED